MLAGCQVSGPHTPKMTRQTPEPNPNRFGSTQKQRIRSHLQDRVEGEAMRRPAMLAGLVLLLVACYAGADAPAGVILGTGHTIGFGELQVGTSS